MDHFFKKGGMAFLANIMFTMLKKTTLSLIIITGTFHRIVAGEIKNLSIFI